MPLVRYHIGKLYKDEHAQSTHLGVHIGNSLNGVPLSIKVAKPYVVHKGLKRGDWVMVKEVVDKTRVTFHYHKTLPPESIYYPEEDNMPKYNFAPESTPGKMSQDRVRFYLSVQYYREIKPVLWDAFGMDAKQCSDLMQKHCNGFWIVCRPSQFARFLIYRNEAGIQNGFKDLKAELTQPKPDYYQQVADLLELDRGTVKKMALFFGYSGEDIMKRLDFNSQEAEVDVSTRRANVNKDGC